MMIAKHREAYLAEVGDSRVHDPVPEEKNYEWDLEDDEVVGDGEYSYSDELSGHTLPSRLVEAARKEEIIAASDRIAMIALSDRIERRFSSVGKVLGNRMLNSTISSTVRMTSP